MYYPHQNNKLNELFSHRPYQGADPVTAQFLFFGLDANYDPNIEEKRCFPEIVSYLADGVRYWKQKGYHHPFRHPDYREMGHYTIDVLPRSDLHRIMQSVFLLLN